MEKPKKQTVMMMLLFATLVSGNALAAALDTGTHWLQPVVGVSSTNLSYHLDQGVVTVMGQVDSGIESAIVEEYLNTMDNVDEVVNRIIVD